jgi:hypothetical protein
VFGVDACGDHEGGVRVLGFVWRERRELGCCPGSACPGDDGAGVERVSVAAGEHERVASGGELACDQLGAERGVDRHDATAGVALWFDRSGYGVPAALHADDAVREVYVLPAEGSGFSEPQSGVEERRPQCLILFG